MGFTQELERVKFHYGLVVYSGEGWKGLAASETAKMNADEMVESIKGEAVRVRHKRK